MRLDQPTLSTEGTRGLLNSSPSLPGSCQSLGLIGYKHFCSALKHSNENLKHNFSPFLKGSTEWTESLGAQGKHRQRMKVKVNIGKKLCTNSMQRCLRSEDSGDGLRPARGGVLPAALVSILVSIVSPGLQLTLSIDCHLDGSGEYI